MTDDILDLGSMGVEDSVEPTVLPADEEARLRIRQAELGVGKKGKYLKINLESTMDPYAKDFNVFMTLPAQGMDPKDLNKARNRLKNFCTAFGIDFTTSLSLNDMVGREGWAILGVESSDEFGDQNFVKRFVAGA